MTTMEQEYRKDCSKTGPTKLSNKTLFPIEYIQRVQTMKNLRTPPPKYNLI